MEVPKDYSKKELAKRLGISTSTLRTWLNNRYYNQLKEVDYCRNQKKLTPKQYKVICKILIELD